MHVRPYPRQNIEDIPARARSSYDIHLFLLQLIYMTSFIYYECFIRIIFKESFFFYEKEKKKENRENKIKHSFCFY